jgi:hypothetical protein
VNMIEFNCASCKMQIFVAVAAAAPADGLCMECRVIAEAAPEDRAALARIFRKTPPPAIQRLMDEVRAGDATPHGLFDRSHNRHNR